MLHHFQGKIEIGTGNGGIISQLKMQNEMKLTDESWISYQQGKGNEEYQKYMEDLTDMQNHVLPYLQSFCSLEEKGVQERREQKIAEKNESRETVPRTGVEANTAVKDAGKAERKTVEQKKAMARKEKKPSIHERLEINKRIIQQNQCKTGEGTLWQEEQKQESVGRYTDTGGTSEKLHGRFWKAGHQRFYAQLHQSRSTY